MPKHSSLALCAAAVAVIATVAPAEAQLDLRTPRLHGEFMRDVAYRTAFETCAALLGLSRNIAAPDRRSLAAASAGDYPQPDASIAEWKAAYMALSLRFAEAMGDRLPARTDAPLQGYWEFAPGPDAEDFAEGGMTVAAVGNGPIYGVSVSTVVPGGFGCRASAVGLEPEGGRLVFPADELFDPEYGSIEVSFDGNDAQAGPRSAFRFFCGANGIADGRYRRAK
ncbi:MAG: hypothetical protein LBR80_13270 [Deltaproteobacteria bacterium]|jgi:hypothetical protein|nr:hypothetical protein [Deltaproteobacteria bacterium]